MIEGISTLIEAHLKVRDDGLHSCMMQIHLITGWPLDDMVCESLCHEAITRWFAMN